MSETKSPHGGLTRRSFLKTTGLVASATAMGSLVGCQSNVDDAISGQNQIDERIVTTVCRGNCNGGCIHDVTVRNGVAVAATAAEHPDPNYSGICLRGIANIHRAYSSERIKYPMRRIGERGSGEWERISWDEAIAEISEKFCYFRDTYGGHSIVKDVQSGNQGLCNGPRAPFSKFASCIGATVSGDVYDRNSCEGTFRVMGVAPYDFSNEPSALLDSSMIIIWGTNPVYTEPQLWRFVRFAQKRGSKVVCFDPTKSATAHKSDQYIPVVPGSDLYIVLAVCNYLIQNGLIDEGFIKEHTNAPFLVRRDNGAMCTALSGGAEEVYYEYDFLTATEVKKTRKATENDYYVYDPEADKICLVPDASDVALEGSYEVDGVQCDTVYSLLKEHLKQYTIADASKESGVPEDVIESFAKEYAAIGPVTINCAYGMDHYQNGHLWFQAVCVMQALTGNFIRPGSGLTGMFRSSIALNAAPLSTAINPVPTQEIPSFMLYDVWRDQKYQGKDYPLKAILTGASNPMSNYANQNRWFTDVFPSLEYWVVVDNSWTDSALHADIVLPASSWLEVMDYRNGQNTPYTAFGDKVIDPLYESKPDSEIIALICNAMGYKEDYPLEQTQEDYARLYLDSDKARERDITWDTMHEKHSIRSVGEGEDHPVVVGGKFMPFPTTHGRLMLYWENPVPRVDFGQEISEDMIAQERFPYFRAPKEAWRTNPDFEKYPLVFLQNHERFRTHTQYFDVPVLHEIESDPYVRIGRVDAESRGIQTGDTVEVYNDRGHVVVKALVDDNFSPGVISIPKGWQRSQFIEGGFCELIDSELDPWGVSATYYDTLANVRKWEN